MKKDILGLRASIPLIILYQHERHYQFEHLERIYDHAVTTNQGQIYITFCDDDDMLAPNHVEVTNRYLDYDKIKCHFYTIDEDAKCADKEEKHRGKSRYSEFGGLTCSLKYFVNFINSDVYKRDCPITDIYFSNYQYPTLKQVTLSESLYFYRKCLFLPNMNVWRFPKEVTEGAEYKNLLKTTSDDYKIGNWLYDQEKRT